MKLRSTAFYVVLISAAVFVGGRGVSLAQAVPGTPQNDSQAHAEHHPEAEAPKPAQPSAQAKDMMASCMEMMSQRDAMMKRMEAMDKKLDDLVIQMNQAKGNQKIDAVAKTVTEMAAQRKQMRGEMMQMQDGMMSHMMQHMQSGSTAMCPMMKGTMMNSAEPKKEK